MRRYVNIFRTILKVSLIRDLQFRTNFFFGILVTIVWQIYTFTIAFALINKFQEIGGWGKNDLLILITTWRMISGFVHFLFYLSLTSLPFKISAGSLDFILCKPLNKLFLAGVQYFGFNNLIDGIINLILILFLIKVTSLLNVSLFVLFSVSGIFIQFFIWIFIITLTFHTGTLNGTFDVFDALRAQSKIPYDAYKGINPFMFSLIIPFVLMTTVPVSFLIDKVNTFQTFGYLITVFIVIFGSISFWNYSIKRYSSASS